MSAHFGTICLKGNWVDSIPDILSKMGWDYLNKRSETKNFEESLKIYNKHLGKYRSTGEYPFLISLSNEWTIIMDSETEYSTDEEWLVNISKEYKIDLIGTCTEGASGSYGLILIQNGIVLRNFLVVEGEFETNQGKPLPEESDFNINENIFEDDIWGIAQKLGADYFNLSATRYVYLTRLPGGELNAVNSAEDKKQPETPKKSKWKFW